MSSIFSQEFTITSAEFYPDVLPRRPDVGVPLDENVTAAFRSFSAKRASETNASEAVVQTLMHRELLEPLATGMRDGGRVSISLAPQPES